MRLAIQLVLFCVILFSWFGGYAILFLMLYGLPTIAFSVVIFIPLEIIASKYRRRYIAILASPIIGYVIPMTFFGEATWFSFIFAVQGGLWSFLLLLVLAFSKEPDPWEPVKELSSEDKPRTPSWQSSLVPLSSAPIGDRVKEPRDEDFR